jgi:hypothetical protein
VFERLAEETFGLISLMTGPEDVPTIVQDEVVPAVPGVGLREGRITNIEDENYGARSKEICLCWVVRLTEI